MSETTKLKITTVTPVTIGSGVELSPYADYFIDKGQVFFIDKNKMVEKIMQKGDNCLDRYIYGVANGIDNNHSKFDLRTFLLNDKIVQNMDEVISYCCSFTGNSNSKLPIKSIVKSPLAKPYFPGSSIKGALKTILMYNWLKTNKKEADKTIERVINDGNFDWLEKQFEYKEDDSKTIIRKNVIQQVSDSQMLPKDANVVVDCDRKVPLRFECIAKGQTTEFELTLEDYKWKDLANQANEYVKDVLEREYALVEKDKKLIRYYNFLVEIEDKIIEAEDNIAYIRIGFGKGYYLNSLGIAIYDYVIQEGREDLYSKFENFINVQFKKNRFGNTQKIDLEDFPKTRLFVAKTQEPLGWVKIEKIV